MFSLPRIDRYLLSNAIDDSTLLVDGVLGIQALQQDLAGDGEARSQLINA